MQIIIELSKRYIHKNDNILVSWVNLLPELIFLWNALCLAEDIIWECVGQSPWSRLNHMTYLALTCCQDDMKTRCTYEWVVHLNWVGHTNNIISDILLERLSVTRLNNHEHFNFILTHWKNSYLILYICCIFQYN